MTEPEYKVRDWNRPEDRKTKRELMERFSPVERFSPGSEARLTERHARVVYKLLTGRDAPDTIRVSGQGDRMTVNDVVVSPKTLIRYINDPIESRLLDTRTASDRSRRTFEKARTVYQRITGKAPSDPITIVYRLRKKNPKYFFINDVEVTDKDLASSIVTPGRLHGEKKPFRIDPYMPYILLAAAGLGYYLYRRK